ncbi:MAG TPA: antitoxin HicB [Candidatus Rothia avistercoris]|uniref:Antitoxin HicB n=1 Tax=Candidatus Rothia avistercoris TaxID=2840479 RepID=A0A9D2UF55_9MICC|nr:antitoxin HicB [Rothia nasimurium]HJD51287.1 antitoxin HicB [Candidatus Rothia avistercoris]
MKTDLNVLARPWAGGWELIIDEDNATQVRSLTSARQQVIDYMGTLYPDIDFSTIRVHLIYEKVSEELESARRDLKLAQQKEEEAAAKIREVVRQLRQDGLSLGETAAILEVSKARVQQLQAA